MQMKRFNAALAAADRLFGRPPFVHTASTAAALLFASTHFTMLRSGIGLYGLWPSRETMVSAREKGGLSRSSGPFFRGRHASCR